MRWHGLSGRQHGAWRCDKDSRNLEEVTWSLVEVIWGLREVTLGFQGGHYWHISYLEGRGKWLKMHGRNTFWSVQLLAFTFITISQLVVGQIWQFFFSNSIYIKYAKRTCKPHLSMTFHFSAIACVRYLLTGRLHKKLLKTGFSDLLAQPRYA